MGNPHPTKSKPCKIGRKHTNATTQRRKASRAKGAKIIDQRNIARRQKRDKKIAAYYRGETPLHPEKS